MSNYSSAMGEEPHADLSKAAALCTPTGLPPSPFLSIFIIHILVGPGKGLHPAHLVGGRYSMQVWGCDVVMTWRHTSPHTSLMSLGCQQCGSCEALPPAHSMCRAGGAQRLIKERLPALGCLPDHSWHFCD